MIFVWVLSILSTCYGGFGFNGNGGNMSFICFGSNVACKSLFGFDAVSLFVLTILAVCGTPPAASCITSASLLPSSALTSYAAVAQNCSY